MTWTWTFGSTDPKVSMCNRLLLWTRGFFSELYGGEISGGRIKVCTRPFKDKMLYVVDIFFVSSSELETLMKEETTPS